MAYIETKKVEVWLVTAKELADWLMLGVRRVQQLVREGVLHCEDEKRDGVRVFDLASNIQAYMAYLQER